MLSNNQAQSDEEIALEFATWTRLIATSLLNNEQRELARARAAWLEEIADRAKEYKQAPRGGEGE